MHMKVNTITSAYPPQENKITQEKKGGGGLKFCIEMNLAENL